MYSVSKYKQYAIILLCVYRERKYTQQSLIAKQNPTVLLPVKNGDAVYFFFFFFFQNKTQRCTDMLT